MSSMEVLVEVVEWMELSLCWVREVLWHFLVLPCSWGVEAATNKRP